MKNTQPVIQRARRASKGTQSCAEPAGRATKKGRKTTLPLTAYIGLYISI